MADVGSLQSYSYAKKANGNVPLMCIFLVSLSSRCARVPSL